MKRFRYAVVALLLVGGACGDGSDDAPVGDDNSQVNSGNGSLGYGTELTAKFKDGVLSGRVMERGEYSQSELPEGSKLDSICMKRKISVLTGKYFQKLLGKTRSDKRGRWSLKFDPPSGDYQVTTDVAYDSDPNATFKCYAAAKIIKA